jgi:hypothetical protein
MRLSLRRLFNVSDMKILLNVLYLLIFNPRLIISTLYDVAKAYSAYKRLKSTKYEKGLPVLDILDLFPNLDETVEPVSLLYGSSLSIDFVLLKSLAKRFSGECDYFEIGTWRGESVAVVSPFCKSCITMNLSSKELEKMGWGGRYLEIQRIFSKRLPNVIHIEANSHYFDFSQLKKFDLIFIDGDHSYKGVKQDTENAFRLLKDDRSIIVWHDYSTNFEDINYEVLAGIIDGTPELERKYLYQVSNTLCAIYIKKEYKSREWVKPVLPDKKFIFHIQGKRL